MAPQSELDPSPMRILILSQFFEPEPVGRGLAFAHELKKMGHTVEVLTGFPNYPGGKVYEGYRVSVFQSEQMEGIPVHRVPLFPSHDQSPIKRVLTYVSFALSASVIGPWLISRPDVIYVYSPPPTVGLAAIVLGFIFRVPFVYDIQDLWPDTLPATGMLNRPFILRLVGVWCQIVYWCAAKITVISPGFKRELIGRGVPPSKIEVIYNWCDERYIQPIPKDPSQAKELGFEGHFNIVFAGNMGKAQALDQVLAAAQLLNNTNPRVQFIFIGGGVCKNDLAAQAVQMGLGNVKFLDKRPMSEIQSILNLADVLLVHLKNDGLFKITIPSKTQAALATGKPILMAVGGNADELIKTAKAGVTCPPEDPQALANTIEFLSKCDESALKQFGENGRNYYLNHLSLCHGTAQFTKTFKDAQNLTTWLTCSEENQLSNKGI